MQTTCLQKCLKISTITQSPHASFLCTCASSSSFCNSIPNHPVLELIEAAAHNHRPIDFRSLHARTITAGLIKDPFSASRIVEFFLKSGPNGPPYARAIFSSIDQPDVYTWNAMIWAHTHSADISIKYYFRMLERRAPPNSYTFGFVVKACCNSNGDIGLGRKVHGQILKRGVEDLLVIRNSLISMYCNMAHVDDAQLLFDKSLHLDLIAWNSLISGYGKIGDVESARHLFDKMPTRSLVSWTAMIDGYVRNGSFLQALGVFSDMQVSGMKPDVVTLVSVLKACAQLGALDQGRWVHVYVERNDIGSETNVVLWTAIIDMYAKCGCIDVALDVFDRVSVKDVITWNAMIGGLAMHGHGHKALELFWRIEGYGVVPNVITFINVLCACAHAGLVKEGIEIFKSMKEVYGIEPRNEHYGCMADILGRAGYVREAEKVLTKMPMDPQASQWGALLAACRIHNDVVVGERVGRHLVALEEPNDEGRCILLSNMYARVGRWGDAVEMRRVLDKKGIKKEKGGSFIEWNGVLHEFGVGDRSHPQSKAIYAMLGEVERNLKMVGYVHDTSEMLLDMYDDEENAMV